ncbi:hypothetical protein FRX31_025792 [Thalictrum thalictroides]|uniref:Defensin-like protein n=1 Tax=Thalictrum thalictroides TaxID=46969 RepID=A0A7J6VIT0_THATH|nr:hypothetical protein FRX31_025792 [Thalictrum thalictroides]
MEYTVFIFTRQFLLSLFVICLLVSAPISAEEMQRIETEYCRSGCKSIHICNQICKADRYISGTCKRNHTFCCCRAL